MNSNDFRNAATELRAMQKALAALSQKAAALAKQLGAARLMNSDAKGPVGDGSKGSTSVAAGLSRAKKKTGTRSGPIRAGSKGSTSVAASLKRPAGGSKKAARKSGAGD